MSSGDSGLQGMVPDRLKVRSARIHLEGLEVLAEIGFHEFEVGAKQRLLIGVEIWLEDATMPADDDPSGAWNYDLVRSQVHELAGVRRYNLQETLGHALFARISAMRGVAALRVRLAKPDVYPDASAVGIEIASFCGAWPDLRT